MASKLPLVITGGQVESLQSGDTLPYSAIQDASATDKVLGRSTAGAGVIEEIPCTAAGRALISQVDAAGQRSSMGLGSLSTQSGSFSGTASGTNTGDQDLSAYMIKSANLSDLASASSSRSNLGLGTLAVQDGTFSGTSGGTNTGDQTNIPGNAATVTTNANLTGPVTSVGNATTIADAELAAIAGLTSAADRLPYFTGLGTAALATFTAAARKALALSTVLPQRYGGICSNNTTDAANDIDITAGIFHDATRSVYITPAAMTLRIDGGTWVAGTNQPKLDTGSEASGIGYHIHAIYNATSGASDWLISLSATAPTLPSGYTHSAWVWWIFNDASSVILPFRQDGDVCLYREPILDVNDSGPGTSAVLKILTVPLGIKVLAQFYGVVSGPSAQPSILWSSLDQSDLTPSGSAAPLHNQRQTVVGVSNGQQFFIGTDTSGQIRYRAINPDASTNVRGATAGWSVNLGRTA